MGADLPGVEPIADIEWNTVGRDAGLAGVAADLKPDVAVHAAFLTRQPPDWTDAEYQEKNLAENLALMKALAAARASLVLVSSSAVYGSSTGDAPLDESCPLRPLSPYALAKAFQETAARFYAAKGMPLCIARPFNLAGPGQRPGMLLPDWVSRAVDVARGKATQLNVRNRATTRDFIDVRDAVAALRMMVGDFRPGDVFNVASGTAVSLMQVSDELQRLCPAPLKIVETAPQPAASDAVLQRGSSAKLRNTYGWRPKYDWQQSLADLWDEIYRGGAETV